MAYPVYTAPKRLQIGGIDTLVVDPHNEALLLWYELQKKPGVLLHVDSHCDMSDEDKPFNHPISQDMSCSFFSKEFEEYAKNVDYGSFISVAMFDGVVNGVYHMDPRQKKIETYGRAPDLQTSLQSWTPKVWLSKSDGRIKVDRLIDGKVVGEPLIEPDVITDLSSTENELVLDIDLDGIHYRGMDKIGDSYQERLEYLANFLQRIKRPALITIARSQTPYPYVCKELVDELESDCISMLRQLYK